MVIYEPSGKAREYSPLALNLYDGCEHGCVYCYAPGCRRTTKDQFFSTPSPRSDIVEKTRCYLDSNKVTKQVLLSFIGDPYSPSSDDNRCTEEVCDLFRRKSVPYAVLTKGGYRCLRDIDIFAKSNCMIGATLTFLDIFRSIEFEPKAASPEERLDTLSILHSQGIKTFASFEPVIDAKESLALIERTVKEDSIDLYKIGKINNFRGIDKTIDWEKFTSSAISILRDAGKEFYIKDDLAAQCKNIEFLPEERDADLHCMKVKTFF